MGQNVRRQWTAREVHISGGVYVRLGERGVEVSERFVLRELNLGREVDPGIARRALAKTGEQARKGEVWVLDPQGSGLYVLSPAPVGKLWTCMGWWRLSAFGRAVVGAGEVS